MSKSTRAIKPLTHRIGDKPSNQAVLDQLKSEFNKANKQFRRVLNGVLVTEAEYQDWLERGGHAGSR